MEIIFKRNMSCNFAVLPLENPLKDNYQTRILLENQVHGLLPCKMQRINGKEYLYYEITGSQSLENLYEKGKFDKDTLKELFLQIVSQRYLLLFLVSGARKYHRTGVLCSYRIFTA